MRTLLTLRPPQPSPPPCLFSFRPNKRFHFLTPCSSLKQTKKQKRSTAPSTAPQSLRWFFSNPRSEEEGSRGGTGGGGGGGDKRGGDGEKGGELELEGDTAIKGTILAGVLLVGVVGGFATVGYVYKDQINAFLTQFSTFIEGYGPAGYALFVAVYAGLEILAIPAIPLTMSAGLLFGSLIGTIVVSISGTVAASAAFLIARYFAREQILKLVEGNKKFLAIDKAIGENGFRVVTLLCLSPLLPFSLGNYLYGLTSVKFVPYMLGSWLGMLPGTWAYVSAGAFGRAIIQEESEIGLPGGNGQLLTLGLGLLVTAIAAAYVTQLAKVMSLLQFAKIEPLVCKEYTNKCLVLIPYHKGGRQLHIGFQEFTEDLATRSHAIMDHLHSIRVNVLTVCQSRSMDSLEEEGEDSQEKEGRSYGSLMIQRLTGSEEGRIDHMLQDKTFEHPYLQALGSHT